MNKNQQNSGAKGIDGTTTKHKGESQQSHQKGTPIVGDKRKDKHTKD